MNEKLTCRIGAVAVALAFSCGGIATATAAPGFAGTWMADGPNAPRVTLNLDSSFNGTDGCNVMNGRYLALSGQAHLGLAAKTMMYCGEDIWFEQAAMLEHDGDKLRVLDSAGTHIGTLQRDGNAPDPFAALSSQFPTF